MPTFADDAPPTWPDAFGWAAETAVTTVVGLTIGLLFFPAKWYGQWYARRRQESVARYRDAQKLLRAAQLDDRFPLPAPDDDSRARAEREREVGMQRAWDESQHILGAGHDGGMYELITSLAELYRRGAVVPYIWSWGEEDDPRPEVLEIAIKALTFKSSHRYKAVPVDETRLTQIRRQIEDDEAEAESRYEQERKARREHQKQEGAKVKVARQAANTELPEGDDPQVS